MGASGHRIIEAFRQTYIDTFGESLRYSSFHGWFTPELCEFLKEVVEEFDHGSERLQERFEGFREVFVVDATVITLIQRLFEVFPGFGDDYAGAKLHVIESTNIDLLRSFPSRTPERTRQHNCTQDYGWRTRCCCMIRRTSSTRRWT